MRSSMASNEVRIISGLWKGRKLRFNATADLRPSLGRVRETLFNWLIADLPGARCLDLFAGSGALGFEALSRGAAAVTFVEKNRLAAASLRDNVRLLNARHADVMATTAERFLRTAPAQPWDVVFFDPPFADMTVLKLLEQLLTPAYLQPDGIVYIERSKHEPLPYAEQLYKRGQAGDCHFGLLSAPAAQQIPP
jgi:16S rRNA (guanine966-N2)-methyltransferase